jgi:O-antigen/teichoic acid export membrane protein
LKNTTAKAIIWSLSDNYAGFALKFVFAIAITRLLTPHDYGLVAYMGLFLGIATWLSDFGFGTSLIQKKDVTDTDYSTGYFFNIFLSLFFFIIYFISAPYIAVFFHEPLLKNIMRVTSINLILNALCYIHIIKLIKSIQFKQQAMINFFSSMISGAFGLSLALMGYNYWALIFQTLSGSILRMFGLWYIVKWVPIIRFSWSSFKKQFKFGSKVFIQGLLENIFNEIQSLIIGKNYQTAALGNYSRGKKFYDLFIVQTGIAFNIVLYPSMVQKTDEQDAHKKMYIKTYGLLFFFIAPISLFLFLLSDQLIKVLLTNKWIGAVPFMQLYFIAGFIFLLLYFNSTTILSANKPNVFLIMDIIQKLLIGISLVITYKIGISAIIIGWLIAYYLHFFIYEVLMYKLGFFNPVKYHQMIQVIICILPSIMIFLCSRMIITKPIWLLILNIILQPLSYLFVMWLCGFQIYKDFTTLVIPFLSKLSIKKS